MSSRTTTWDPVVSSPGWFAFGLLLRPLQLGLAFPSALYLAAMTIFLFRPPDLDLYHADRIALGVLVFFVALRSLALRERIPFVAGLSLPMLGLVVLAVLRALREPFDSQTWSLVASKFVVPFILLHLAILVFRGTSAHRHFEIFVILALAYLVFTAVAFLADARSLIFPQFILDESLGIHADRARGPFLHAVSTVALGFRVGERRLRHACLGLAIAGLLVSLTVGLGNSSLTNALRDRTAERGPVEARMAVYDAAWGMFQERPLTGWTAGGMYSELARRMQGYHLRSFYVHNTYLSLLIEFGIPGLALYGILFFNLFRLGRTGTGADESPPIFALRKAWPILLCVYLFNALCVDMAYH